MLLFFGCHEWCCFEHGYTNLESLLFFFGGGVDAKVELLDFIVILWVLKYINLKRKERVGE